MLRLFLSFLLTGWFSVLQQAAIGPRLDQPLPGQALQGVVSLAGSTALEGFAAAQIEFRYENDPAQTWFLIQDQIPAVESGVLASWDTTTISDGIYHLRLRVTKSDGSETAYEVAGVRVRNYTLIETDTPAAAANATLAPSAMPTATAVSVSHTPTPQPPNPASVTNGDLRSSVTFGLAVIFGLFILFAIYLGVRRLGRR